jgi:hypothetical protein
MSGSLLGVLYEHVRMSKRVVVGSGAARETACC